jgi:hypothetical protein
MKKIAILMFALSLLVTSVAFAKRSPPENVPPVRSGDVEFRVPHGQMGCLEAWNIKQNELLWRRQIYVVKYTVGLERDVQDVFIKSLELKDNSLLVKNERNSEYQLDLETLDVKVIKGALVESRK